MVKKSMTAEYFCTVYQVVEKGLYNIPANRSTSRLLFDFETVIDKANNGRVLHDLILRVRIYSLFTDTA